MRHAGTNDYKIRYVACVLGCNKYVKNDVRKFIFTANSLLTENIAMIREHAVNEHLIFH